MENEFVKIENKLKNLKYNQLSEDVINLVNKSYNEKLYEFGKWARIKSLIEMKKNNYLQNID